MYSQEVGLMGHVVAVILVFFKEPLLFLLVAAPTYQQWRKEPFLHAFFSINCL